MKPNKKQIRGFTLIEILLSITLVSVLVGLSMPVYQNFQLKNDLDIAANTIVQSLRRAQVLSQAMDGDTSWGVNIQSELITLFKGASYATRDTDFDEGFDMSNTITPSGAQEVVFAKFTGEPTSTGTATLTSSNTQVKNIIINAKGMLEY
jgi:prepilin-type N-terminal cleavage/methylation domain-containing protein